VALGSSIALCANLEPGLAETELSLVHFRSDQEKAVTVSAGMMPLTGQDIAEAVHWTTRTTPARRSRS
jgi:NADP-dependent 3-hydroxy acid dehydrogenase YdfG